MYGLTCMFNCVSNCTLVCVRRSYDLLRQTIALFTLGLTNW